MPRSILTHPHLEDIKRDRHKVEMLLPEHSPLSLLPPCQVRILMVTDGAGSFGTANFGLGELIEVLTTSTGPHERFVITSAHRQSGDKADIQQFRFDRQDLTDYDEIWLFGVDRGNGDPLTDAELKALTNFMDQGGGVFATGDHEDLGVAMCGRVPRVRSMRKWYWRDPGTNNEPVAPPANGPRRHDTLVRKGNDDLIFDNQSDDVPQSIQPKMYQRLVGMTVLSYPHPVLCGLNGPIDVMPDHPHEGECYEPTDLEHKFTFDEAEFVEYPSVPGLPRPKPEVIAYSTHGLRRTSDEKGHLNSLSFGGIGVYDGHQAHVGRVLVDSTWHHFFNINLVGRVGASPPFDKGFASSEAGLIAYEEIKAYFRNIAHYLAPIDCHAHMRVLAGFWVRGNSLIDTELRLLDRGNITSEDLSSEYWRIGKLVRGVYRQFASPSLAASWAWDWMPSNVRTSVFDEFATTSKPSSKIAYEFEQDLEAIIHGAVVYSMARRFRSRPDTSTLKTIDMHELEQELHKEVCAQCCESVERLMREVDRGRDEISLVVEALQSHREE